MKGRNVMHPKIIQYLIFIRQGGGERHIKTPKMRSRLHIVIVFQSYVSIYVTERSRIWSRDVRLRGGFELR